MIYMKLYETFTRQVTNYEKELGLTAASASKLNIKEKPPVDEMESFLNNG